MQPLPSKVGKSRPSPAETERPLDDTAATPTDHAGDEPTWDALGSTRVLGEASASTPPPMQNLAGQAPAVQESDRIGDYEKLRKIGEGAMGEVFLARQLSIPRQVALKILFPHIASNPKLVERLYREGLVMVQLDHPNIVQAFGVGEDQGRHFIALEYIDGKSMQKWLTALGRISVPDAVRIIIKCAKALEYAHNLDFVHRDIKPDNILITRKGEVKVADLGMVKIDDEE